MDNKIEHFFVLKPDGKIYWVEKMPEYPKSVYRGEQSNKFKEYEQALQSAIDNAVEVSNQKEVIDEFFHSAILPKDEHGRKEWKINTIQSIQCSVHVYETNAVRKRLALVTFSQPEREETQEELQDELEELRLYKHACNESIAHLHRENERLQKELDKANEFIKDLGNPNVDPMKPERTKEEILKDALNNWVEEYAFQVPYHNKGPIANDDYYDQLKLKYGSDGFKAGAKWMEEYRSQSSPVESKWVIVDEELPPLNSHVDVWMNKRPAYRFANYYTGWNDDSLIDDIQLHKITHWMRPPSPPELPIEEPNN